MESSNFAPAVAQLFREYFSLYDHEKIDRVDVTQLPLLIRACGATPLESDFDMLVSTADPNSRGSFDFDHFCKALKVAFDNSISEHDVREAFQGLDYANRGYMTPPELRYFLGSMGDKFSMDEMRKFFEELSSETDLEGNIVYNDAVFKMIPEMLR